MTSGNAMEFIIRDDNGQIRSVIQTNEMNLAVGERVLMTQTDRVRLSRAGGPGPGPVNYNAGYGAPYGGGPIDAVGGK